jgi:hypothetical protein
VAFAKPAAYQQLAGGGVGVCASATQVEHLSWSHAGQVADDYERGG